MASVGTEALTVLADRLPLEVRQRLVRVVPGPVWARVRPLAHGSTGVQRWARRRRAQRAMLRVPPGQRGAAVVALRGDRGWAAHLVTGFRSVDVLADHFHLVCDALEAAEVPYAVLAPVPNRRRVVVVASDRAAEMRSALEAGLTDEIVHAGVVVGRRVRRVGIIGIDRLPAHARRLRIFRVLASDADRVLSAAELGCEVQVWERRAVDDVDAATGEPMPAGTLVPPCANPWVDRLPPAHAATTPVEVDGRVRPVLDVTRQPHFASPTFPIDVVYTWVDGRDPEWVERRRRVREELGEARGASVFADNESRYVSRDELRYSLRSLEMYAGWVRHVYLVTDGQVPGWLDTGSPGLSVVTHRELFGDRGRLPTFNSHAIESQLHHIHGLSEHFLYLNDDVFFGRPVVPQQFFLSNGVALFHQSPAKIALGSASPDDWPVMAAGKNNRDLVLERYGHRVTTKFKHVPHPLHRSVLAGIERDHPDQHAITAAAQFRSHTDLAIPSSLAHYVAYFTGRAAPGTLRHSYVDIAEHDASHRLEWLLRVADHDVFCLNDHDSSGVDATAQELMVRDFLEARFPLRSRYEKDG